MQTVEPCKGKSNNQTTFSHEEITQKQSTTTGYLKGQSIISTTDVFKKDQISICEERHKWACSLGQMHQLYLHSYSSSVILSDTHCSTQAFHQWDFLETAKSLTFHSDKTVPDPGTWSNNNNVKDHIKFCHSSSCNFIGEQNLIQSG